MVMSESSVFKGFHVGIGGRSIPAYQIEAINAGFFA